MLAGHGKTDDGQGHGRKRNSDQHLRHTDAPPAHEPVIAGEGEDGPAGDGVTVHRGHHRLRENEDAAQRGVKCLDEVLNVLAARVDHARQIHSRGECRAGPGKDDGADAIVSGRVLECALHGQTELQVESAHFPMSHADGEDAAGEVLFEHEGMIRG